MPHEPYHIPDYNDQMFKDRSLAGAEFRTDINLNIGNFNKATQDQHNSIPQIPKPKVQIGSMSPETQAKWGQGLAVAQGFIDMISALKSKKEAKPGTDPGQGALQGIADEDGYVPTYY